MVVVRLEDCMHVDLHIFKMLCGLLEKFFDFVII